MKAHWVGATVGEHRELVLEKLPFEPGESVEILIVPRQAPRAVDRSKSLRDSVLQYEDPFEPVAADDWEALR